MILHRSGAVSSVVEKNNINRILCIITLLLKKITAIFLIAILFFNWYGYRIISSILTQKADKRLELQLDNAQYSESELIEIKIPLNIPYQYDQPEFERYYGEVEVNGKYYMYVKRKIEHGVLTLKCIPNEVKEKIEAAGNDFFKNMTGLDGNQAGKKESNSGFAKSFWSEYDDRDTDYGINSCNTIFSKHFLSSTSFIDNKYRFTPLQPPESIVS